MKKNRKIMIWFSVLLLLSAVSVGVMSHPAWGGKPKGERLERMMHSKNYKNGQFQNLHQTQQIVSNKRGWEKMLFLLTAKKSPLVRPNEKIEAYKTNLKNLDLTKNQLIWFGHSSYLLICGGKTFLVDPVLTRTFPSSLALKPFEGTDIYSPNDLPNIDYLIITHDHFDHLDYGTVKAIRNRVSKVICPLGVGAHFEKWEYDSRKLVELDWWENVQFDSLRITCLPTRHFSGRTLKRNVTLWGAFMLEFDGETIFISGDGGYDDHFKAIAEKFPEIDLAILENGQYNEDWKYIHTMPHELPQEIHDLKAKKVLTVHNSKFSLARHAWNEPIISIKNVAKKDSSLHLLDAKIGLPCCY